MSTEAISSTTSTVNTQASSANTAGVRSVSGNHGFSDAFRNSQSLSSGSADLDAIFEAAGRRYNIPSNLLKAVAQVESNFRPNVTSRAGAQGIMQLMPGTARHLGVEDVFDPEQNIMGGARYLRELLDRFDGDISLALAAYNAGWPTVLRHGGIPPFRETQAYVPRVLELFHGGDITAGVINLSAPSGGGGAAVPSNAGGSSSGTGGGDSGAAALLEAMSQMVLMRVIEMQMGPSGGRERSRGSF
ncbi:MAG: lytic transglycosylase domain-containing protein [Oscillospiraceae bacterium]|nr:lytic transglycosylase domain-containing protein [Oscillospiraceae bacterium]